VFADCDNGTYYMPLHFDYIGDLTISGPLIVKTGTNSTITGNVTLQSTFSGTWGNFSVTARLSFESDASVIINGTLSVGPGSQLAFVLGAESSLTPPLTVGSMVISPNSTSILIDASQATSVASGAEVISFGSSEGAFAAVDIIPPLVASTTNTYLGMYCSSYLIQLTSTSAVFKYSVTATNCPTLPLRLLPPPLPDRTLDVGALIGSLFAALVLLFVLGSSVILLNTDLQDYCLPYRD